MKFIYSQINPDKLLHMIHKVDEFKDLEDINRKDLVPEKEFIQLSALNLPKGRTFRPHQHVWKPGEEQCISQESWVVIKGRVECRFYDTNGDFLDNPILESGDCSITLEGGHNYFILEDDTLVYEYKTGPYKGITLDKEFLDEI